MPLTSQRLIFAPPVCIDPESSFICLRENMSVSCGCLQDTPLIAIGAIFDTNIAKCHSKPDNVAWRLGHFIGEMVCLM